ncbi:tabinhibitin 7 isoform X1 [Drosophila kikkawai]|uniref:Tabinhibitin 7 isoform X1 n=1 Tax=Drosophila kikkawai TaxID=30033 RepID=A0A6P4J8I3_DROKI|nr:allergen Tab y 5.0101 [Drosophila kikkawai]
MKLPGLIAAALLSICSLVWGKNVDYCNTPYCKLNHLACHNPDKLNVRCPPGSKILPMERFRNAVVTAINEFRNLMAGGGGRYLKPAASMALMSYSPELEEFARLAVITCSTDKFCLSSKDFYYVGYIHDAVYYVGPQEDLEDLELILRIIQDWTYNVDTINLKMGIYLPSTFEDINTVNAALLMAEKNTHVGCSALRFTLTEYHNFVFACAFGTDLMVRKPIYRMSAVAGSACKYRDATFKNLCSAAENYDNGKGVPNATIFNAPVNITRTRKLYMEII